MFRHLPPRPDMEQLRRQAKDLRREAAAGDPEARRRIEAVSDRITLAAAQLALAREHGFASWPRLKLEVDRKTMLNSGDVDRLARLVEAHPELARERVSDCYSDADMDALGYLVVARFHGLLEHHRVGELARVLLSGGAPPEGELAGGETELIGAASYGEVGLVRSLIAAGAHLEAVGSRALTGTALTHAVEFGNTEVVDVLIAAGAIVHDIVEAAGAGSLEGFLASDTPLEDRGRAFRAAAVNERLEVLDELLASGVPVDADTDGSGATALHWAAWHGKAESVRHLLDRGADPNRRDTEHSSTPLGWCQHRHSELAAFREQPDHTAVERILAPPTAAQ